LELSRPSPPLPPPKKEKKIVKSVENKMLPSRLVGKGKRARSDEVEADRVGSSSLGELQDDETDELPKRKKAKNGKPSLKASPVKKTKGSASKHKVVELSSEDDSEAVKLSTSKDHEDESESEMSVVLDEVPARKRSKSASTKPPKPPSKAKPKPVKDADLNLDPDEAEIKRLQSWLLKCGIRKLWHRELAPYDTPRAKIKHLKSMLSEVGMDGRYSAEKAGQIKEERELKADLEAVKGFAERWGQGEEEDYDDIKGRPKRKLAKGLTELAMFDDDDESD
jgi:hypothetical protein